MTRSIILEYRKYFTVNRGPSDKTSKKTLTSPFGFPLFAAASATFTSVEIAATRRISLCVFPDRRPM